MATCPPDRDPGNPIDQLFVLRTRLREEMANSEGLERIQQRALALAGRMMVLYTDLDDFLNTPDLTHPAANLLRDVLRNTPLSDGTDVWTFLVALHQDNQAIIDVNSLHGILCCTYGSIRRAIYYGTSNFIQSPPPNESDSHAQGIEQLEPTILQSIIDSAQGFGPFQKFTEFMSFIHKEYQLEIANCDAPAQEIANRAEKYLDAIYSAFAIPNQPESWLPQAQEILTGQWSEGPQDPPSEEAPQDYHWPDVQRRGQSAEAQQE